MGGSCGRGVSCELRERAKRRNGVFGVRDGRACTPLIRFLCKAIVLCII